MPPFAFAPAATPYRSRFGSLYLFVGLFIGLALVTRLLLLLYSRADIDVSVAGLTAIFATGLFYDLVAALYFTIPMALYLTLVPDALFNHPHHRTFYHGAFFLFIYLIAFDVVSEWIFWDEFGVRYNFIAVDYLVYTHEVLGNIWESYPVIPLLTLVLAVSLGLFHLVRRFGLLDAGFGSTTTLAGRAAHGGILLLIPLVCFFSVDITLSRISTNRYHNELAKNGVYALFSAFLNNRLDYGSFYLREETPSAFRRLRELLKTDNAAFVSDDSLDITRRVSATGPEKRYNVVLITIESLSARYMGYFGHREDWTPHLDRLSHESITFTRYYATGTRTVRGMESLVLSVPPTPGRSIVKRPNHTDLFSLGFLFQDRGYDTRFIYGGYGYFDNMNAFYAGNGFGVVDRTDLSREEVTFENIWGVADENLFDRVIREADRAHGEEKPFLHFVMTTSNHRPYTYPNGRIDIPSPGGRAGGVKYTDYAIDRFLRMAREKPWFDNTVFVIMSDHCGSSAGRSELPAHQYHIPLIIHNPTLFKPRVVETLTSQVDFAPTLLGLLGWSYDSRFFGKDALRMDPAEGRALIGNYQKLGLIRGDRLVVLSPQKGASAYRFVHGSESQEPIDMDQALLRDAITYYQTASHLYENGLNRRGDP